MTLAWNGTKFANLIYDLQYKYLSDVNIITHVAKLMQILNNPNIISHAFFKKKKTFYLNSKKKSLKSFKTWKTLNL